MKWVLLPSLPHLALSIKHRSQLEKGVRKKKVMAPSIFTCGHLAFNLVPPNTQPVHCNKKTKEDIHFGSR